MKRIILTLIVFGFFFWGTQSRAELIDLQNGIIWDDINHQYWIQDLKIFRSLSYESQKSTVILLNDNGSIPGFNNNYGLVWRMATIDDMMKLWIYSADKLIEKFIPNSRITSSTSTYWNYLGRYNLVSSSGKHYYASLMDNLTFSYKVKNPLNLWGNYDGAQSDNISAWVVADYNNQIPIADAGPDQAILEVDSTVQLNGTQSYDLDGDPITYSWTMVSKPLNSNASLSDPTSQNPTFQAEIHGDYVLELIVSDAFSSSGIDQVVVSFNNLTPVANAGLNQSVVQGETVCFDGSGSSDVNLDPLSYSWILTSAPSGSSAVLDDLVAITPCLTTDLAGTYEVSLVVNDGFIDSEPSTATVLAVTYLDSTFMTLQETIKAINEIEIGYLKNQELKNALTYKINATLELVDQGAYSEALAKLQNDILGKTDGCANSGIPDKNDWIQDCTSQNQVYPLIIKAIKYLESMK